MAVSGWLGLCDWGTTLSGHKETFARENNYFRDMQGKINLSTTKTPIYRKAKIGSYHCWSNFWSFVLGFFQFQKLLKYNNLQ